MASKGRRRSKRVDAKPYEDGDAEKRFPWGIAETVSAVAQYWNVPSDVRGNNEKAAIKEFSRDSRLLSIFDELMNAYGGAARVEGHRTAQQNNTPEADRDLYRIIYHLSKGSTLADFHRLRLVAEYVGLPTGLFLLFTQLVSDERRENLPLKVVRKSIAALRELESHLETHANDQPQLRVRYSDKTSLPDISVLRSFSEAYNKEGHKS